VKERDELTSLQNLLVFVRAEREREREREGERRELEGEERERRNRVFSGLTGLQNL
jgi:hypothetical protein